MDKAASESLCPTVRLVPRVKRENYVACLSCVNTGFMEEKVQNSNLVQAPLSQRNKYTKV